MKCRKLLEQICSEATKNRHTDSALQWSVFRSVIHSVILSKDIIEKFDEICRRKTSLVS